MSERGQFKCDHAKSERVPVRGGDGYLTSRCPTCHRARAKAWREVHRVWVREYEALRSPRVR